MLIAGRKKNCLHKRVCNYASMWWIWCKERERENLLVLIGRAITKTKMREKRGRKRGRINCRGIKGEGQMYVKEESEPQVHEAFEWSSCCVRATLFCHFLYLRASENSFHSFVFVQQASVFFKGILNYDESREIKRYFTFLWYILKYIGTTEKFQNIRLLLSVIVKNVDLAFNKRKFEIFVSWLQYCDDYSNITSFDQFKILISMKNSWRNPSFNISTIYKFFFSKDIKIWTIYMFKETKKKIETLISTFVRIKFT